MLHGNSCGHWLDLHPCFYPLTLQLAALSAQLSGRLSGFGVARGVFSNEAGLGSAPIAHAAASTKGPVSQGLVAMLGTFIDTIIVCSFTALAIIASGAWTSGETGAALTSHAFDLALPGVGGYIIAVSLTIFAFTTILGWSYYCERSLQYLFGVKIIMPFRAVWSVAALVGATLKLELRLAFGRYAQRAYGPSKLGGLGIA